ncbi:MAG: FadR family transcriptional regulator [Deltaproteobacteria bacterium]|nr:FadR family transcriptional regulator [Deltaproteobacteria bacterium]
MPLDLARIEKKAISESVAEQLRLAILRGEVAIGERLPPERELAPRFGTNRNTLREAIRSLEAQGLVVARQGDGVRVADFRQTGELSLLPDLIRVASKDERNAMLTDVLLMRRRMAVEVAGLAANRATPEHIERLQSLMAQQIRNDGDILLTMQADLTLYQAMVAAAGSVVATLMFHSLGRLSQAFVERMPALLFVHPEYIERMGAAVDAIARGDAAAASAAVDELLTQTDNTLMQRVELFG